MPFEKVGVHDVAVKPKLVLNFRHVAAEPCHQVGAMGRHATTT